MKNQHSRERPKIARSKCPYCHDEIVPDAIEKKVCAQCLAIYHNDCFAEFGGCVLCSGSSRPAADVGVESPPKDSLRVDDSALPEFSESSKSPLGLFLGPTPSIQQIEAFDRRATEENEKIAATERARTQKDVQFYRDMKSRDLTATLSEQMQSGDYIRAAKTVYELEMLVPDDPEIKRLRLYILRKPGIGIQLSESPTDRADFTVLFAIGIANLYFVYYCFHNFSFLAATLLSIVSPLASLTLLVVSLGLIGFLHEGLYGHRYLSEGVFDEGEWSAPTLGEKGDRNLLPSQRFGQWPAPESLAEN